MTKRAYLVLKQLKIIRYRIVGSIIFPILLSTYSLADMRVDQFFSFIMLEESKEAIQKNNAHKSVDTQLICQEGA